MAKLTGEDFLLALFVLHTLVVAHDEGMGALHEAGEFGLGVRTQQVGTRLGDEDVVLAMDDGFLDEEEFVARVHDDGMAVFHP